MTQYRYLMVRISDDNPKDFGKVRKVIHDLSKENHIDLADFGADFNLVRSVETASIITIFENVMARTKEHQKYIDETKEERQRLRRNKEIKSESS